MKKSNLIIAAGTLVVGLTLPPSLHAQQDTTRKQSTGEVATGPSYASLVAALDGSKANLEKLAQLTALKPGDVQLVNVAPLTTGKETEFQAAIDKNSAAVAEVREAVSRNDVLTKALADNDMKLTPADVVTLHVTDSGQVHLFVNRKPM